MRTNLYRPPLFDAIHPMGQRQFLHLLQSNLLYELPANCCLPKETCAQRWSLSGGLCGSEEFEADDCWFCFHDMDARALSDGLDMPNAFAICANNLSNDCNACAS